MRKGEAHGFIVVQRPPAAGKAPTFASLGFHSASPSTFKQDGQSLKLQIGAQGANQILIGLLLPAIQAPGIVSPRDQKVVPAAPLR